MKKTNARKKDRKPTIYVWVTVSIHNATDTEAMTKQARDLKRDIITLSKKNFASVMIADSDLSVSVCPSPAPARSKQAPRKT